MNAPAKPKSSERTSQEDLEPSEEAPRCERRRAMRGEERMHVTNVV